MKWLVGALVIVLALCLPGGLAAAWYFNNGTWALISIGALIFFMAG